MWGPALIYTHTQSSAEAFAFNTWLYFTVSLRGAHFWEHYRCPTSLLWGRKPTTVTACERLFLIQVGLLQSSHTNIGCGVGGWSACRCNDPLHVCLSQKDLAQRSWQGSNRPGPPRPHAYCASLLEGQFDESVLGSAFCECAVKPAGAL